MTTWKCTHCGYEPVATDAPICPKCGGRNPNPAPVQWLKNFGLMILFVVFMVVLAVLFVWVFPK